MSSIAKKTIENPVLVFVVFALLGMFSFFSLKNIPISLYPDMNEPMLSVVAMYDTAGPESVEKSVTQVLEQSLSGINNLKKMTSSSSEGMSMIELEFNYGSNLDKISSDVRDKIAEVASELPAGVKLPSVYKFSGDSMPIMTIAVRGNRSADDLKKIVTSNVVNRVKQAQGVAQIYVGGGRKRIVRIEISQNRLEAYKLTMTEVANALSSQNYELGGGRISEGSKEYILRTLGEFADIKTINDTIVSRKEGYIVRVSDIGTAAMGYSEQNSTVYINGQPGVYLSINKQSGSNTVAVARAVKEKLDELKSIIPNDVQFEILSDSSVQVNATIKSLTDSAMQGAALAMLILFLFLRNFRSTVIMGVSIPFSILITLLSMKFAGISLNMMTMTGLILGVGMIVDSSVVVLENIHQYRERGMKPKIAATIGTQEMFFTVLSGGLTTICVFLPILFFQSELGFIGQMLPEIIFTIIISLVSSLFVALFLVPVLASHFIILKTRREKPLRNGILVFLDEKTEFLLESLKQAYLKMLAIVLRNRWKTLIGSCIMIVASGSCFIFMNIELLPDSPESVVTLKAELPIGTNLHTTDAFMRRFEKIAREEIKGYKTIITSAGGDGEFSGLNRYSGSIQIVLPPSGERVDSVHAIKAQLRKRFREFPSVRFTFTKGEMEAIQGSDIDILVYSDDIGKGIDTSQRIIEVINKSVPDVTDVAVNMTSGLPQMGIQIDRNRAYALGVDIAGLAREINAGISGVTATIFHNGGKDYDVVLMLRESDRNSIADLDKIFVMGSEGPVALSNFTIIRKSVGPVSINRENQMRLMHITGSITTATRADLVEKKIQAALDQSIVIPEGVSIGYSGSWNGVQKTGKTFIMIIITALLLVYGTMAAVYGSFKDPMINMFTIPFGIIGIIAIYLATGNSISMFTAFGFVMLVGIAVNNGIILVDQTNLLVSRGHSIREACLCASGSRLRPILMTTMTTLIGMVPMAFFASENSEMMQPIGLSVFGGLASSTLVTLFLIPTLYSLMHEQKNINREQEALIV